MYKRPFKGSDAISRGDLTRNDLRRKYTAVFRDVYIRPDDELTALVKARAAWLATGATLGGLSAAAVLRSKYVDAAAPAEIIRADRHCQSGMIVHNWNLGDGDVCSVGEIRVTTPARTAFDIGRTRPVSEAVPILDQLLRATKVAAADVIAIADARPRTRGVRTLRNAVALADGKAESPQESRLRLHLVLAGLPPPVTQLRFSALRIRVDMAWSDWKVIVEYDGAQHWDDPRQRQWDIERLALLEEAGWVVIRVSSAMMWQPSRIVDRVARVLIARGCPLARVESGRYVLISADSCA